MTGNNNYQVQLVNLWKSFGDNTVLKGVDLEVKGKEVVCLIGGSGSGKSTMLRCINSLEMFDKGKIVIDGRMFSASGHGRDRAQKRDGPTAAGQKEDQRRGRGKGPGGA